MKALVPMSIGEPNAMTPRWFLSVETVGNMSNVGPALHNGKLMNMKTMNPMITMIIEIIEFVIGLFFFIGLIFITWDWK
jgi:hypothetical protein